MNKVYLVGDTHWGTGDEKKLFNLPADKDDLVIICGDCGLLFDPAEITRNLDQASKLPFTLAFIDGNHENFDMLKSFPVIQWHGGQVHQITSKIYHLMRGEIFDFFGKSYFTFGGAASIDKAMRVSGVDWWPDEIPTWVEIDYGWNKMYTHHNCVDVILTHTAPLDLIPSLVPYPDDNSEDRYLTKFFNDIMSNCTFTSWYFGHFHKDITIQNKFHCLYNTYKVEGE